MFGVLPSSGSVVVSGPLSWDYVAISYFQVEANNTQASYNVEKTDVGTTFELCWALAGAKSIAVCIITSGQNNLSADKG